MPTYFDDSIIRQVLQATDIVDLISSYLSLKRQGKDFVGLCPFHDDHKPSMSVSPAKQIFKCFSCGAGGSAFNFLMMREKMTFPEAVRFLAQQSGIKLPESPNEKKNNDADIDRETLERTNRWAARFFRDVFESPLGQIARDYVADRGISDEIARRFGLGYAPDSWDAMLEAAKRDGVSVEILVKLGLQVERETGGSYDRFRHRVIFPVLDALGRVIAFGGRTLGDDPAKYLNSPESELFDKSRALYGIHAAKDAVVAEHAVIVVEGYTDCLMAHQYGIRNVVATLGTALTSENAKVLARYAQRIVLMFDTDQAGQKAAERAIDVFFEQQKVELFLAHVPQGKDPCDFLISHGKDAFDDVVAQATEALEYKWQLLTRRLDENSSLAARRQVTEDFFRFVAAGMTAHTVDAITQGFLVNRIAKLIAVPVAQVQERIRRLRHQLQARNRPESNGPNPKTAQLIGGSALVNAQREVLEVLLNRPELFALVTNTLAEPDSFEDKIHQAVAAAMWPYLQTGGTELYEMLGTIDSLELSRVITDMVQRGEARGNFEQTLAGALKRIEHELAEKQRREARNLINTAAAQYGEDAEAAALLEYQAKWRPNNQRVK